MEELEYGKYYHIYNRGINGCNLFLEDKNFEFFIKNYAFYTHLTMETYAYCLMKNHFHLQIKVKSIEEQQKLFITYRKLLETDDKTWVPHGCKHEEFKPQSASRQLAHLFTKYTKNFNAWNHRTGKLFEQSFKRKHIEDESYLINLVCYIHRNPFHHGITNDFQSYPYSSFKKHLMKGNTLLEREEVLSWFGGKKQYILAHEEMKLKIAPALQIE